MRGLEVASIIRGAARAGKRNRCVHAPADDNATTGLRESGRRPRLDPMIYLLLAPAVLSLLVLAAHFLREGNVFVCAIHVAMALTLLLQRRPWMPRFMQAFLAIGLVVWGLALSQFVHERQALGEPTLRLFVILGAVMAVDLLAIALLESRPVAAHFAKPPATPGAGPGSGA